MKKVMRSPILKGIAFALCLVCVAAATLTAGNALQWFYEQSERRGSNIYQLESSFEDSKMLNSSFVTAFTIIDNALQNETTQEMLDRYLEQNFFGDYYAKLGDKVLKNAELTEGDTMDSPYYMVIKPGEYQGNIQLSFVFYERWANPYEYDYYVHPDETTVTTERRPAMQDGDCILLRLTQGQADSLQAEWLEGQRVFDHALMLVIILFFLALIAYIYLLFVTGRRAEDEEVHLVLIDRMYVECNLAILVGAAVAGVFGIIIGIPVLRLRGDYLAIVTLAFGEIIKNLINILYVGVDGHGIHVATTSAGIKLEAGGKQILKGALGISGTATLYKDIKDYFFPIGIVLVLLTLFIVQNLVNSRSGRAIMSTRDNRIAAESVGINVTKYKLLAFTVSAALAGVAGVLYAHNLSMLKVSVFDYNMSILILVYVVLGGIGSLRGSMIAAIILYALPELLRGFSNYRMLIYAIVLIIMMLFNWAPAARNWRSRMMEKIRGGNKKKEAA